MPNIKDSNIHSSTKDRELLRRLGMSELECSIYLNLLEKPNGESIDKVIISSGPSTQEVEVAIKNLVDKGCISVKSNRIEANAPRDFLSNILHETALNLDSELKQVKDTIRELELSLDPSYWEKRTGLRPEDIILPVRDLESMEEHTLKMISNAKNYVYIFAEKFDWYENINQQMSEAIGRGVKARILMLVKDKYTVKRAQELKELNVEVRHCAEEWYPVRGTLIDDRTLVFLIWATRKTGVERPIYYRPHYTENVGLIRIFKDAFQKRWEEAKTL